MLLDPHKVLLSYNVPLAFLNDGNQIAAAECSRRLEPVFFDIDRQFLLDGMSVSDYLETAAACFEVWARMIREMSADMYVAPRSFADAVDEVYRRSQEVAA